MLFPYKLKNVQSKEYTAQTCPNFVQLLTPLLGDPPAPQKNPLVSFLLAPSFLIKTPSEAVLQSLLLFSSPTTRDYQNNRDSIIQLCFYLLRI